jgi:hypothetical protein
MKSREITNQYRLTQWGHLLSERLSGETIDNFCERKGITRPQFFYWQRKLRKTVCTELITQSGPMDLPISSGWAICEHTEIKPEKATAVISVKIGEYQIAVDDNFNPELLSKVCKTLVTLC